MPLQATSGAASYDAFGGGVPVAVNYIEDVYKSTPYLGPVASIVNDIDLSTNGGLVWIKNRDGTNENILVDNTMSASYFLSSNTTNPLSTVGANTIITAFNTNGFTFGTTNNGRVNNAQNYSCITFRKKAKFFDIQTWTGTGSNRTISHALDSVPACIMVKRTDADGAWQVYHRSLANTEYLSLNTTAAKATGATRWNSTTPTSTVFSIGTDDTVNASGGTYVAYIFAHDAGGFGLTGTDNVISCGEFTTNGDSEATVTLGYEPQWILIKRKNSAGDWILLDNMRGWVNGGTDNVLYANLTAIEGTGNGFGHPTATGFEINGLFFGNSPYIYIAIRRGPMKVPTSGTSVFSPVARTGTGTITTVTAGFAPDLAISAKRTSGEYMPLADKLRGPTRSLFWQQGKTDAEDTSYAGQWFTAFTNTGVIVGPDDGGGQAVNASGTSFIQYYFQRAPSFFDAVCYIGTGSATTQTHNLGVVPELIIVKSRSASGSWAVYSAALGNTGIMFLNTTAANAGSATQWNSTTPTSTIFSIGSSSEVNFSGRTYVAYLFATCAGVSKVGSYTGTGTLTTINCGFTGGARYVLIKRTDSTSDWLMWDTARGMVSGTDPSISSNYQGAEINANSVYTIATGFQLLASPSADVNTNGGSYIFLAIA